MLERDSGKVANGPLSAVSGSSYSKNPSRVIRRFAGDPPAETVKYEVLEKAQVRGLGKAEVADWQTRRTQNPGG